MIYRVPTDSVVGILIRNPTLPKVYIFQKFFDDIVHSWDNEEQVDILRTLYDSMAQVFVETPLARQLQIESIFVAHYADRVVLAFLHNENVQGREQQKNLKIHVMFFADDEQSQEIGTILNQQMYTSILNYIVGQHEGWSQEQAQTFFHRSPKKFLLTEWRHATFKVKVNAFATAEKMRFKTTERTSLPQPQDLSNDGPKESIHETVFRPRDGVTYTSMMHF